MKRSRRSRLFIQTLPLVCLLGTVGCSFAPTYQAPTVVLTQDAWQDDVWHTVTPLDAQAGAAMAQAAWWELYGDPQLNALMEQLNRANPNLAAALARYNQANAYTDQLRASQAPTVDSGAVLSGNRQSDNRPLRGSNQPDIYNANTVGLSANYTLDFWGRVRNSVAAGAANASASAADLATLRLLLQAQLADTYVSLRGADVTVRLLTQAVGAYARALDLTQNRHAGGVASGLDVARAATQLSLAKTQISTVLAQRAAYEHAIASLIGVPAMNFQLAASDTVLQVPHIPSGLPSTLLLRRPDIAAAERRTAAANATVGVARAAYYPDFSLTAVYGYQNTGQPGLLSAPNSFWTIGPSMFLNLFDAGKHDAQLAIALAALDAAGADYRATVLAAFQQVQDNLARLKYSDEAEVDQTAAEASSARTLALASNRYREGAVNYLEVVTAQATALAAQRDSVDLHTLRLRLSIDLIRALGGGWSSTAGARPH